MLSEGLESTHFGHSSLLMRTSAIRSQSGRPMAAIAKPTSIGGLFAAIRISMSGFRVSADAPAHPRERLRLSRSGSYKYRLIGLIDGSHQTGHEFTSCASIHAVSHPLVNRLQRRWPDVQPAIRFDDIEDLAGDAARLDSAVLGRWFLSGSGRRSPPTGGGFAAGGDGRHAARSRKPVRVFWERAPRAAGVSRSRPGGPPRCGPAPRASRWR